MAIYAIGDVQGCYESLQALLGKIHFDANNDQLWFAGDLVNRGSKNLETLRFIRSLGGRAVTVLGNHDLHLLATARGYRKENGGTDTFHDVVAAPDFDDIIDWLKRRPLMHHDADEGFTMVHAGLPPQWDVACAKRCANEVQQALRGELIDGFLANMYGDTPDQWSDELHGWERLRYITNSFTRLRYCDAEGREDFINNQNIGTQPCHLLPWFHIPDRQNKDLNIIFGHWASLGHHIEDGIYALDSGCVWGGKLTAMRLGHTPEYFQVDCAGC